MRTVALLPVEASTQEIVHQQLETVASETGIIPKAILSDEGSDLSGGVDRFCMAHPETIRHRDMPHICARLLKKRLEKDERWNAFIKQTTQTKFQTAQTELAFLVPAASAKQGTLHEPPEHNEVGGESASRVGRSKPRGLFVL